MSKLFDADSLLQVIRKNIPKNPHDEYQEGQEIGLSMAVEMVCNEPTVEAEPIRHGHWIDEEVEEAGGIYSYIRCSVCGDYILCDSIGQIIETPYCPWCGAKMDEVEE